MATSMTGPAPSRRRRTGRSEPNTGHKAFPYARCHATTNHAYGTCGPGAWVGHRGDLVGGASAVCECCVSSVSLWTAAALVSDLTLIYHHGKSPDEVSLLLCEDWRTLRVTPSLCRSRSCSSACSSSIAFSSRSVPTMWRRVVPRGCESRDSKRPLVVFGACIVSWWPTLWP
jgi:hypothetical protein